ncbi:hypothetical protein [Roseibium album]|uniref:hypothetical protein n=1 Tax=Roseibium album TaxID=311410 RepID=UPI003BAE3146
MSVALAQDIARSMVERESRGSGDLPNAMKRLEERHKLPSGLLHSLRYRPPKDLMLSVWQSLVDAYQTECLRQARLLEHELKVTRELTNDLDPNFVQAVERLLQEVRGEARQ